MKHTKYICFVFGIPTLYALVLMHVERQALHQGRPKLSTISFQPDHLSRFTIEKPPSTGKKNIYIDNTPPVIFMQHTLDKNTSPFRDIHIHAYHDTLEKNDITIQPIVFNIIFATIDRIRSLLHSLQRLTGVDSRSNVTVGNKLSITAGHKLSANATDNFVFDIYQGQTLTNQSLDMGRVGVPESPSSAVDHKEDESWANILENIADKNGVVVFTVGTKNYARIVNSFVRTAIQAHGIRNFVFVALSAGMCGNSFRYDGLDSMTKCYTYPRDFGSGGNFGSTDFARLVQVKSEILFSIVRQGYTALLTDADIFYLKNPLPMLHQLATESSTDLLIQDDAQGGRNSGFMYMKPTNASTAFLSEVLRLQRNNPQMRQQVAVNAVLKSFRKIKVHVLSPEDWPCGVVFFQRSARRMFPWQQLCSNCILVHNNWIVGDDAKEYRAKEFLQWSNDDNGYYSSEDARYLFVGNPDPYVTLEAEERALKAALRLGRILGRILILPWLRCRPNCKDEGCRPRKGDLDICPLHTRYYVRSWNKFLGPSAWREMMFRYNPLTQQDVRLKHNQDNWVRWDFTDHSARADMINTSLPQSGLSSLEAMSEPAHFIQFGNASGPRYFGNLFGHEAPLKDLVIHNAKMHSAVSWQEARKIWNTSTKVLRFQSLYNVAIISEAKDDAYLERAFQKIFQKADLMQFR